MAIAGTNQPSVPPPARRLLQAFAFDPMSTRLSGRRLEVSVPYEPLDAGPVGGLIKVVDYDGARGVWYQPVDLDDPAILARGGMRPVEGDPRTHQQVVYAVAMSVIERFERFLGRRFRWRRSQALVLVPHAFEGRNAFFDPTRRAVLFGYYRADDRDPGPNLPRQIMFTCLSGDIVAHEVTHAIMHRLRPYFSEATNVDVFAWHEAFADLVALFHHFAYPQVVSQAVASGRGDLREGKGLFDLAQEFGLATGRGAALRSALGSPATPDLFRSTTEPHMRGACFVAGVFDAFMRTYQSQIADLLRIATGGSGELPPGNLHPDLVDRVAREAVRNADRFLAMVVRAFDFLPVVDVTFGDVVRAIVTADRTLYPDDDQQLRATLVECLRARGIYPEQISSLADEALAWPVRRDLHMGTEPSLDLSPLVHSAVQDLDPSAAAGDVYSDDELSMSYEGDRVKSGQSGVAAGLQKWGTDNAFKLGLDPNYRIAVHGVHVVFQQAADRQPRPLVVVQYVQRREDLEQVGIPMRAGSVVVARVDGAVEHLAAKPLPLSNPAVLKGKPEDVAEHGRRFHEEGTSRAEDMRVWLEGLDDDDALSAWTAAPAAARLTFANLHVQQGVA